MIANPFAEKISHVLGACVFCGARGHAGLDLCKPCRSDLPLNSVCCSRCALPLPSAGEETLCGRCLQSTPAFDCAVSPYLYEVPCDYMITRLKFGEKFYFARLIGELLAAHIRERQIAMPDLVVPVPLHSSRLRDRGFNQSERIGRILAGRLGLLLNDRLVTRILDTRAQTELPARQRKQNVRNAFRVDGNVAGARIALVDDVVTTSFTVNEVARVLRTAGAAEVQVWSFARAAAQGVSVNRP